MPTGTRPFVPGVAQVEMIYTSANERVENVYHVLGTGTWDDAGLAALITAFQTWETATAKAQRSDNVIHVLTRAWDMSSASGAEVEATSATTGVLTPGHLPNNATLSLKANTGLRGRSFRGRTYWIGLNDAQLDASGQSVTNAAAASLTTIMETLRTTAFPNGGHLVVVSLVHNGAYRSVGVSTPVINYVLIDQYVDSQRRRLIGHNRHR